MKKKDKLLLQEQFKLEVHDKASEVDPDNDHDWHSLTIGWAIAKGVKPKEAVDFATYIRYSTSLG